MKLAVGIFAKTIGLSSVKTRLAADIGKAESEAFYAMSVDAVADVLNQAQRNTDGTIVPVWTLAEEAAPNLSQWSGFNAIWTGEGGLGKRLANVSEALFADYDAVALIGTDSPHLRPNLFEDVLRQLEQDPATHVAGPADDGGFYLYASTRPIDRNIWEKVTYSVDTTLEELVSLIEAEGQKVKYLASESDVDVVADLQKLERALSVSESALVPAQTRLLDWLKNR